MRKETLRIARVLVASLTIALLGGALFAHDEGGERKTFVGRVVGLACYIGHGSIGEAHRECAMTCAKGGIPLAILDQQGHALYLPLARDHHSPANAELMSFVEAGVRVTGTVVEKDGMKAILLESVSKTD